MNRLPFRRSAHPQKSYFARGSYSRITTTLVAIAGLAGLLAPAEAAVIRVGFDGDPNCDVFSIEDALDMADNNGQTDEIRLALVGGYVEDSSYSSSEELIISGGWLNCGAATAGGKTLVIGDTLGDFATFTFSGSNVNVTLRGLRIQGAGTTQVGVLAVNGANVLLESVLIQESISGVSATNNAEVIVDADTEILDNVSSSATRGAGIDCSTGARIELRGDVIRNHGVDGGGIQASTNCFVDLKPGAFVSGNTATRGGGLFLESGAFAGGGGSLTRAFVNENQADEGGAYYITDAGTAASHFNLHVKENEAVSRGGAIVATNGGAFTMNVSNTVPCNSPCSLLSGNLLTGTSIEGSAGAASAGGSITLYQTHVELHSDTNDFGRMLVANDSGSVLELEGVSMWNNEAVFLVSALEDASATVAYSSVARNDAAAIGGGRMDSIALEEGIGGQASAFSSVFTDIGGFSGSIFGSCVMANNLTNIGGVRLSSADPLFANPDNGDLHLTVGSPAIDYCDGVARPPTRRDIDLDLRPIDSPFTADLHGTFDLGVDEFNPADVIFIDGFESGSTSAWSSSSP